MSPPPSPMSRLVRLLDATVDGGERGEDEKHQRVRSRVEREVEEAVDERSRTTGERAECDAASDFVVRLHSLERRAEEHDDEGEADQAADDPGVREYLQIVVVRLLKPESSARRVVARIDCAERAKARAEQGMVFDDLDRALPEVRASRRRVCGVDRADETAQGVLAAEVEHAEQDRDDHREAQPDANCSRSHALGRSLFLFTPAATPDGRGDSGEE